MLAIFRLGLFLFIGGLVSASAAFSANVALLIGNSNYAGAGRMPRGVAVLNATSPFRDAGYAIISGRNLDARQTQRAIDGLLARVDGAEGAAVVLAGQFVHSDNDTWFLPVDTSPTSLGDIYGHGVSINVLLDVISAKPGRAAIFLATTKSNLKTSAGLKPGIGQFQVPQGVLLVKGRPDDIDHVLRQGFLLPGMGFSDALAAAPNGIEGFGFISNLGSLRPGAVPVSDQAGAKDDGYWQAVLDMGGPAEGVRAYLRAFPDGRHAEEARNRLNPGPVVIPAPAQIPAKTPAQIAQDREAALNLDRATRLQIQRNLTALGYNTYGIDGMFGRGSRKAIAAWQRDRGLPITGYITAGQIGQLNRQAVQAANERAQAAARAQRAREAADRDYWVASGAVNGTEKGLRRYLRRYPNGLYATRAQRDLQALVAARRNATAARERDAWDNAALLNTIAAYQAFLSQYPAGYHANIAVKRLNQLRQAQQNQAQRRDDKDFWAASGAKAGDEQGLRAYLDRYPNGLFSDLARTRLGAIQAAKEDARKKREDARNKKEQLAWSAAVLANSVAGYRTFLLAFPDGQFAGQARDRLSALQAPPPAKPKGKARQAELKFKGQFEMVERILASQGYDPGPTDGVIDSRTRRAIRKYQRANALPVTGFLDAKMMGILTAMTGKP